MATIKAFLLSGARKLASLSIGGNFPAVEGLAVFGARDGTHFVGTEFDGFGTLAYGHGPTRSAALRELADQLDAAAPK
jgi:hypothetical protein